MNKCEHCKTEYEGATAVAVGETTIDLCSHSPNDCRDALKLALAAATERAEAAERTCDDYMTDIEALGRKVDAAEAKLAMAEQIGRDPAYLIDGIVDDVCEWFKDDDNDVQTFVVDNVNKAHNVGYARGLAKGRARVGALEEVLRETRHDLMLLDAGTDPRDIELRRASIAAIDKALGIEPGSGT